MTSIESVTLEVADPADAGQFYTTAFGLGSELHLRASDAPTAGFRGFTLSSWPSTGAVAWPGTPASRPTAPVRTGS